MPRLFSKFFTIIWLVLASTVIVIMVIVNLFQTAPLARELAHQKRELILNLTANVLERNGEEAARRFVHMSEDTAPLGLMLSKGMASDTCAGANAGNARSVLKDGLCYQITVSGKADFLLDSLAILMPWVAILVSSTISAAALARYLIRPVVHLRDGLRTLAQGRFDIRIGYKMAGRRDEITALAHDFDTSAARLQEFHDAQQRLFHDVSHELRSPLSRLQAVVGVLRQSPAKLEMMLGRIDREVERLDVLVGEVLTLARVAAGSSLPLRTQTLDVIELLNEILGDAAFEAQTQRVSITTGIDASFLAEVEGELIYRAFETSSATQLNIQPWDRTSPWLARRPTTFSRYASRIRGRGLAATNLSEFFSPSRVEAMGCREGGMAWALRLPGKPSSAMADGCMR